MAPYVWLVCGILAVGFGQWLNSFRWYLHRKGENGARTWKPSIYIFAGAVLSVGIGATATVYGWNLLRTQSTRTALLSGLVAECVANNERIKEPAYMATKEEELRNVVPYTRLRNEVLAAALASNAFIEESDRELYTRIMNLNTIVTDLSYVLTLVDLTKTQATDYWTFRKVVNDQAQTGFKVRNAALVNLLLTKYQMSADHHYYT